MANTYTPEIKAQVIADFKAGASYGQLTRTHGVPKTTAYEWTQGIERTPGERKKEDGPNLDQMAWSLVGGSFLALGRIQGVTTDDAWLRRQDADKLAILYGVISDKLVRLLGAAREREAADEEPAHLASTASAGG